MSRSTPSAESATLSASGQSIRLQLSLRFVLLSLLGVAIAVFMVARQIKHIDDLVQEVGLGHQVEDLADALLVQPDGTFRLELPERLVRIYETSHSGSVFVVRDPRGQILFEGGDNAVAVLEPGFRFPDFFYFFQAVDLLPSEARSLEFERFGLTERVSTELGDVFISVAQHKITDDFLNRAVAIELVDEAAAVGLPLLVCFLLIGLGVVRYSTRGLSFLSDKARDIGPESLRTRLPVHYAPTEVMPLAVAFNDAMDRVAEGFEVQKRFTIDAAHQLKTPLAVLRTRLETLAPFQGHELLAKDLDQMDRLVHQLLTSARLNVVTVDPTETMDLAALAREVVGALAPLAIDRGLELEVLGADAPVTVSGEAHLAAEALRNLVENALGHAPAGTTVTVQVSPPAMVEVLDQGRGVPDSEKKHIFAAFAQGQRPTPQGTGMGLAIVSQVMRLHGGRVSVDDRPGGGAVFRLEFPEQAVED